MTITKRPGRRSRLGAIGRLRLLGSRVLWLVSGQRWDRGSWIGARLFRARLGVGSRFGRMPYRFDRRGGPLRPHHWIRASGGGGRAQRQENSGRSREQDRRQAPRPCREGCLISRWGPWRRDPVEGSPEPQLKYWIHRVSPSHWHTSSCPAQTTQPARQVRSQAQQIHRAEPAIARSPDSNATR